MKIDISGKTPAIIANPFQKRSILEIKWKKSAYFLKKKIDRDNNRNFSGCYLKCSPQNGHFRQRQREKSVIESEWQGIFGQGLYKKAWASPNEDQLNRLLEIKRRISG